MNFDRLNELRSASGKSLKYLCDLVGERRTYIGEAKARGNNIPDAYIGIWADDLGTTVAYLKGETDQKEKPTDVSIDRLPPDVQELVNLCLGNPELASALLEIALLLQNNGVSPELMRALLSLVKELQNSGAAPESSD